MHRPPYLSLVLGLLTACDPGEIDGKDGTIGETVSGAVDGDADGFPADEDCNDGDAAINPAASEVCDGDDKARPEARGPR